MTTAARIERREFLKLGAIAGSGLLLGVQVPWGQAATAAASAPAFQPNVFLRIAPNDVVTIWCARSDMGQGVRTALPMIVADELDADWSQVRVEQADAHPSSYGRMMTVGSSSVRNGAWMPLCRAGAAARGIPGVTHVVQVSQGVAVVGNTTWAALQGAKALDITWQDGGFALSSAGIFRSFAELAQREGVEAQKRGDAPAALASAGAGRRIEVVYEAPYLAHATMEPMNCTADAREIGR